MCAPNNIKLIGDDFSQKVIRCAQSTNSLSDQEPTTDHAMLKYTSSAKTAKNSSQYTTDNNDVETKLLLENELYGIDTIREYIGTVLEKVKKLIASGMKIEDASFITALLADLLTHKKILAINKSSKSKHLLRKNQFELRKENKAKLYKSLVTFGLENDVTDCEWYIDSGATSHMSCRLDWIENMRPFPRNQIIVANGEMMNCAGIGNISICSESNVVNKISDVIYVPDLTTNLISVRQAVEKGFTVVFDHNGCSFYRNTDYLYSGVPILRGSVSNGLYSLNCIVNAPREIPPNNTPLWDRCLGYLCEPAPQQIKTCVGVEEDRVQAQVRSSPCDACLGNLNCNLADSNSSLQNDTVHI